MTRRIFPLAVCFMISWPASALVPSIGGLVGVPLDTPLAARYELDGQALDGLYQGDYDGTNMAHNFGAYLAASREVERPRRVTLLSYRHGPARRAQRRAVVFERRR